jgi:uncharacterized protein
MTMRRVLTVVVLWNAACWTVIGLLVAPVVPGGAASIVAAAALALLPIVALARSFGGGHYPSAAMRMFLFRPFWYAQLLLPLLAVAGIIGAIVGAIAGNAGGIGRTFLAVTAIAYVVMMLAGYVGSRRLRVRTLELPFEQLPVGLDGMMIAQLSDLHVGPHTPRGFLSRIASAVRDASPDLIVFTGDQVDDYPRDVEPFGRAFGDLTAPLGVVSIAGNHDVYAGWIPVRRGLEELGHLVLVNDAVRLEHRGESFWLAGTGDPAGRSDGSDGARPDIPRTLRDIPPDEFSIVLAHNPALWPPLAEAGVDLTLSGHTHYGQLAIPRLGWSLASPFLEHAMETHRRERSTLYINPGTNYWGIPFRIGARPEVTLIVLRKG